MVDARHHNSAGDEMVLYLLELGMFLTIWYIGRDLAQLDTTAESAVFRIVGIASPQCYRQTVPFVYTYLPTGNHGHLKPAHKEELFVMESSYFLYVIGTYTTSIYLGTPKKLA